jgi:hypothetical protein
MEDVAPTPELGYGADQAAINGTSKFLSGCPNSMSETFQWL